MVINSNHAFEKEKTLHVNEYRVEDIVKVYKSDLNIDVKFYFKDIDKVQLLECVNTGYQFYVPNGIEGDSTFYELLENFDWYYMPWKWEHEVVKSLLNKKDKILEVGSGGLGFIEKLNFEGFDITGLELNEKSVKKAKLKELNVLSETIQSYSQNNLNSFDLICSFQVLEHISDVQSFLQAQINSLVSGGRLVICVPNNDSFIKLSEGGILNLPPHHMGRWNPKSLKNLEKVFDIKMIRLAFEPLQDYHKEWYVSSVHDFYFRRHKLIRGLNKIFSFRKLIRLYANLNSRRIKGHSIMVVYEKK